jgi:hypothetical protein
VFAGGPRPVVARFSLFAGVPTLSDNDGTRGGFRPFMDHKPLAGRATQ